MIPESKVENFEGKFMVVVFWIASIFMAMTDKFTAMTDKFKALSRGHNCLSNLDAPYLCRVVYNIVRKLSWKFAGGCVKDSDAYFSVKVFVLWTCDSLGWLAKDGHEYRAKVTFTFWSSWSKVF